jgi:magnesium transporter
LQKRLQAPDFVYYIYVLDGMESHRLLGVITLRELLVSDTTTRVAEVMMPNLLTIDPLDSAADAARQVTDSHLVALPVVDVSGRFVGAVTVDAAIAQLAPPSWRDQAPRLFS